MFSVSTLANSDNEGAIKIECPNELVTRSIDSDVREVFNTVNNEVSLETSTQDITITNELSTINLDSKIQIKDILDLEDDRMPSIDIPSYLSLERLTYNSSYPFKVGTAASIAYSIKNSSTLTVDDIVLYIYLDQELIGTAELPSLESGYYVNGSFNLNGVSAGEHEIGIVAHSTVGNFSKGTIFLWQEDTTPRSDLVAYVYNSNGEEEIYANEITNYTFYVANEGEATAQGPFDIYIVVNNGDTQSAKKFTVDKLEPNKQIGTELDVNFGWGKSGEITVWADYNENVDEEDEYNNTASCTCKVLYNVYSIQAAEWCHHKHNWVTTNTYKTTAKVAYPSNFSEYYPVSILKSGVSAWNGISPNLVLGTPTATTNIGGSKAEILVELDEKLELTGGAIGSTLPTSDLKQTTVTLSILETDDTMAETIIHEFGHAVGLGHPYECLVSDLKLEEYSHGPYPSIMWQIAVKGIPDFAYCVSPNITNADEYQIKYLYNN